MGNLPSVSEGSMLAETFTNETNLDSNAAMTDNSSQTYEVEAFEALFKMTVTACGHGYMSSSNLENYQSNEGIIAHESQKSSFLLQEKGKNSFGQET